LGSRTSLAAEAADTARAAVAELEALRGISASSSASVDSSTNDELKLAREVAQKLVAQWAAAHPHWAAHGGSPDRRRRVDDASGKGARGNSLELAREAAREQAAHWAAAHP
jgi:sugar phosphate isomerase/epimerase